jgi:hypothetical protein
MSNGKAADTVAKELGERLAINYHIVSKWTSFVAVEKKRKEENVGRLYKALKGDLVMLNKSRTAPIAQIQQASVLGYQYQSSPTTLQAGRASRLPYLLSSPLASGSSLIPRQHHSPSTTIEEITERQSAPWGSKSCEQMEQPQEFSSTLWLSDRFSDSADSFATPRTPSSRTPRHSKSLGGASDKLDLESTRGYEKKRQGSFASFGRKKSKKGDENPQHAVVATFGAPEWGVYLQNSEPIESSGATVASGLSPPAARAQSIPSIHDVEWDMHDVEWDMHDVEWDMHDVEWNMHDVELDMDAVKGDSISASPLLLAEPNYQYSDLKQADMPTQRSRREAVYNPPRWLGIDSDDTHNGAPPALVAPRNRYSTHLLTNDAEYPDFYNPYNSVQGQLSTPNGPDMPTQLQPNEVARPAAMPFSYSTGTPQYSTMLTPLPPNAAAYPLAQKGSYNLLNDQGTHALKHESKFTFDSGVFPNHIRTTMRTLKGFQLPNPQTTLLLATADVSEENLSTDEAQRKAFLPMDALDHHKGAIALNLHNLIRVQSTNGSFKLPPYFIQVLYSYFNADILSTLEDILSSNDEDIKAKLDGTVKLLLHTLLAVMWIKLACAADKEIWELLVSKAERWVRKTVGNKEVEERLCECARAQ